MNLKNDEEILTYYIYHEAAKTSELKSDMDIKFKKYNKYREIFRDSYSFQVYLLKYKINKLRKDIKEALRWW